MEEEPQASDRVKVIVDANIVFSGILHSNSRIGDLLINSGATFEFIAPDFLRSEITKHHLKLARLMDMTVRDIREIEFLLFKNIMFISENQITPTEWTYAERIVAEVDPNDAPYIAYAKHFRCKLWSGDKSLARGLQKRGFRSFISTQELIEWRASKSS